MRCAVIGSGIAGNTVANRLSGEHHVSLYEANGYAGGHTHTHDIELNGKHYPVDTGFIVFNEKTYPNFIALLDELAIGAQPTEMSFSVRCQRTGLEYNGHTLDTLFAQRKNLFRPAFYRMVRDILRFNREAPLSLAQQQADMPLADYLRLHRYSAEFRDHYMIPMGAAIWSTDPVQMQQFPARFFIQFFENHGLLQLRDRPRWFVLQGGSNQYVAPLTQPFAERLYLNTPVLSVRRLPGQVEITTASRGREYYDLVVFATHSDQALKLLADPSASEKAILGKLQYQSNEAVLHTDDRILPTRKKAWAAWNYHLLEQGQNVALTYNMNLLQGHRADKTFCVTLNHDRSIRPADIIKRIHYEHPVFTEDSLLAQARHDEISGVNRTFYCGAYWRNGFHEDGVVSAMTVHKQITRWCHEQLSVRRAG